MDDVLDYQGSVISMKHMFVDPQLAPLGQRSPLLSDHFGLAEGVVALEGALLHLH